MAAALVVLAVGFAVPASAAFVRISPLGAAGPGPVEFTVFLEGLSSPVLDAQIDLHFVDESSVTGLSASSTGNPFPFGGANIVADCTDGAAFCWRGGGAANPALDAASIVLGSLTFSTIGPDISIVVSSESRWSDAGSVSHEVDNIGATVAILPEPKTLLLIALTLFALAVLSRSRGARR